MHIQTQTTSVGVFWRCARVVLLLADDSLSHRAQLITLCACVFGNFITKIEKNNIFITFPAAWCVFCLSHFLSRSHSYFFLRSFFLASLVRHTYAIFYTSISYAFRHRYVCIVNVFRITSLSNRCANVLCVHVYCAKDDYNLACIRKVNRDMHESVPDHAQAPLSIQMHPVSCFFGRKICSANKQTERRGQAQSPSKVPKKDLSFIVNSEQR